MREKKNLCLLCVCASDMSGKLTDANLMSSVVEANGNED